MEVDHAALAGWHGAQHREQFGMVREVDRVLRLGVDVAVVGGQHDQRVVSIAERLEQPSELKVETRDLGGMLRRERADDVGDGVDRWPIRVHVRRLRAVVHDPRDDGPQRRRRHVAGVGGGLVQHARQCRPRETARVHREGALDARRVQSRVNRLGPEECLGRLAELGVGERDASVERPPADHLGDHAELGQQHGVRE